MGRKRGGRQYGWRLRGWIGDHYQPGCQRLVGGGLGRFGHGQFDRDLEPYGLLQQPAERLLGVRFQYAVRATDTPTTLQSRAGTWSNHQTTMPNPSTTITAGGIAGRYVRVQLSGDQLPEPGRGADLWHGFPGFEGSQVSADLALNQVATQSSTFVVGYTGCVEGGGRQH